MKKCKKLIISFLLVIMVGFGLSGCNSEISDLHASKIAKLELGLENAQKAIDDLKIEKDTLEGKVEDLEADVEALESENVEKDALLNKYEAMLMLEAAGKKISNVIDDTYKVTAVNKTSQSGSVQTTTATKHSTGYSDCKYEQNDYVIWTSDTLKEGNSSYYIVIDGENKFYTTNAFKLEFNPEYVSSFEDGVEGIATNLSLLYNCVTGYEETAEGKIINISGSIKANGVVATITGKAKIVDGNIEYFEYRQTYADGSYMENTYTIDYNPEAETIPGTTIEELEEAGFINADDEE